MAHSTSKGHYVAHSTSKGHYVAHSTAARVIIVALYLLHNIQLRRYFLLALNATAIPPTPANKNKMLEKENTKAEGREKDSKILQKKAF